MSDLSAAVVARFLQENPDFFVHHADIFAMLTVPHPYQNRAISLGERQVMLLRDKVRTLETRLTELIHEAQRNQSISAHLTRWCQQLLAADAARLPELIAPTLVAQFGLQDAALRVWQTEEMPEADAPVSADIRRYADSLTTPYCGNPGGNDATLANIAPIMTWFAHRPASFALIALRHEPQTPAFGLLALGSDDPQRFVTDMATDFLADVGQLASAVLVRG